MGNHCAGGEKRSCCFSSPKKKKTGGKRARKSPPYFSPASPSSPSLPCSTADPPERYQADAIPDRRSISSSALSSPASRKSHAVASQYDVIPEEGMTTEEEEEEEESTKATRTPMTTITTQTRTGIMTEAPPGPTQSDMAEQISSTSTRLSGSLTPSPSFGKLGQMDPASSILRPQANHPLSETGGVGRAGAAAPPSSSSSSPRGRGGRRARHGPVIGIDLGTTNSCVGVWNNGRVEIIHNDHGHLTTPSCVAFTEDGGVLVGDTAKNQAAINASNTVFQVKRWIGRRFDELGNEHNEAVGTLLWPYTLVRRPDGGAGCMIEVQQQGGRRTYAPEEISALILGKMKEIAEAYLDCPVADAVVAVPAIFSQIQKFVTKEAARLAGLNVVRLITEPSAAALAYAMRSSGGSGEAWSEGAADIDEDVETGEHSGGFASRGSPPAVPAPPGFDEGKNLDHAGPPKTVMVVDWGGGTLDVSIMRVGRRKFAVVAVAGDTSLGGHDIDDAMVLHFAEQFERENPGLTVRGNARAIRRMRSRCEKVKHALSFSRRASVIVDGICGDVDFKMEMTRETLEDLCDPIFKRVLKVVETALVGAGIHSAEVARVILAGGSMRMPKMQRMLSDFFGEDLLCKVIHPDECVAYGATIQAALITGQVQMDVMDLSVVEVVPVTLGFGSEQGEFHRAIERNTPYPTRVVQDFWESAYGDTLAFVWVYEGERAKSDENNLLGKVVLEGLQPGSPGSGREKIPLEAVLEIDEDGILTATLRDKTTGRSASKSFGGNWGRLNAAQARSAIKVASTMAEQDHADVAKSTARWQLIDYIRRLRGRLSLVADEKERIRMSVVLDAAQTWWERNKNQLLDVNEYEDRKNRLERAFGHIRAD